MEKELKRKLAHLILGILLVTLIYFKMIGALFLAVITLILFYLFICSKKMKIGFMEFLLNNFEREKDRQSFPGKGVIHYLIGAIGAILFFEKEIALAAIIILAIVDSVPSILYLITDKKNRKVNIIIGFFMAFFGASIFVSQIEALIAALIGSIFERIDLRFGIDKIDDNLVIPIVCGIALLFLRMIFL